jgi:hypothetical protein
MSHENGVSQTGYLQYIQPSNIKAELPWYQKMKRRTSERSTPDGRDSAPHGYAKAADDGNALGNIEQSKPSAPSKSTAPKKSRQDRNDDSYGEQWYQQMEAEVCDHDTSKLDSTNDEDAEEECAAFYCNDDDDDDDDGDNMDYAESQKSTSRRTARAAESKEPQTSVPKSRIGAYPPPPSEGGMTSHRRSHTHHNGADDERQKHAAPNKLGGNIHKELRKSENSGVGVERASLSGSGDSNRWASAVAVHTKKKPEFKSGLELLHASQDKYN